MTDHIYPLNDLAPHELSKDCPCRPKIEEAPGHRLIIHNSFDGRDAFEMKEPAREQ